MGVVGASFWSANNFAVSSDVIQLLLMRSSERSSLRVERCCSRADASLITS
jgi:hypothetical protein